ncbi:MAG: 50S ribosomal protein L6, partial [Ilumatobacter sp.]|nr:50S ribosomal protein L6 [Ilumatobacter sp.]
MSRIGNSPITVPAGVGVKVTPGHISVKGPKGSLERVIPGDVGIGIEQDGDTLTVTRPNEENKTKALHG